MKNIATIRFVDRDSDDEASVIVNTTAGLISLTLSLRQNGDLLVAFGPDECERIVHALQEALMTAQQPEP